MPLTATHRTKGVFRLLVARQEIAGSRNSHQFQWNRTWQLSPNERQFLHSFGITPFISLAVCRPMCQTVRVPPIECMCHKINWTLRLICGLFGCANNSTNAQIHCECEKSDTFFSVEARPTNPSMLMSDRFSVTFSAHSFPFPFTGTSRVARCKLWHFITS